MTWTLILACILIGMLIIAVEVIFIPGTTVVGFLGVAAMITGIFFSYEVYGNTAGNITLLATILISGLAIYFAFKFKLWNLFALKEESDSKIKSAEYSKFKIGDIGTTITDLRPMGEIQIGDEIVDGESYSGYIQAQIKVEVVQVFKNNVKVKPL